MANSWLKLHASKGLRPPVGHEAAMQPHAEADRLIEQGHELEDKGDFAAALASYRLAVTAAPLHPRAHMNVGNALEKLERTDEAAAAYLDAVRLAPEYVPARFNLGSLLANRGEHDQAKQELREALRLDANLVEAMIVLADVLESEGDAAAAEVELRHALVVRPDFAGAALNLLQLLLQQNRLDEAREWLTRAEILDPSLVREALSRVLFSLNYSGGIDPVNLFRVHVWIGQSIRRCVAPPFTSWTNSRNPGRPLRIGYVSGDFRNHPIALFLRPIFERHDRSSAEVFCYSNYRLENPITEELQRLVDHRRDVSNLDDSQLIKQIRDDGIDILVDLSGHTERSRLHVFARHPAPVQVTWLGYLNTTGLSAIDYRICDWNTDPEGGTEHLHTERLVRMPHSQWCYAPWYEIPQIQVPHAERPDALVFGSFNQHAKISEACLALWCRILTQIPEAELVVLDITSDKSRRMLLERMARRGVDLARVTVRGRETVQEYFNAMGNVDIALDTFPYNGATTTFDALWMGTPLVALRGDRGISRGGYSILRSLPLPELISESPDEYVELNVRLAREPQWRSELRRSMRNRLLASPLMDAGQFVADLEKIYREMWRNWCATESGRLSGC